MSISHPPTLTDQRVLAIVAHPDDETIACLGSLVRFKQSGSKVEVFIVNHGHQGRFAKCRAILSNLGIPVHRPGLLTFYRDISERRWLVRVLDDAISKFDPTIICTHGEYFGDHQEHSILSRLVGTAAFRYADRIKHDIAIWRFEPCRGLTFVPNCFVDIKESLAAKLDALDQQNNFLSQDCLSSQLAEKRSRYWGKKAGEFGVTLESAEVFDCPSYPSQPILIIT